MAQEFVYVNGNKIEKSDLKFFVDKPSPNFSPKKNKAIIAATIKKAEENRIKKLKDYAEKLKYRTDAVATYIKALSQGRVAGTNDVEKYFGMEELRKLRAQRIQSTMFELANGMKGQHLSERPEWKD